MPSDLTVARLVIEHSDKLGLSWLAGKAGGSRLLASDDAAAPETPSIGYLNLIRPHRVQVLGKPECDYIEGLGRAAADYALHLLFLSPCACIIVADDEQPAEHLLHASERAGVALLGAACPGQKVVEELGHYLARAFARRTSVHGVLLEVLGVGVLLTGTPGVGKSELALELVSRGHRLVADDAPELSIVAPDTLVGSCPPTIADFMEVRGLGILNIRELFGDSAIMKRRYLRLIIHLEVQDQEAIAGSKRLEGVHRNREILGVQIPETTLPVAAGHNMAVLVECTVRNHVLRMKGYDATLDFEDRQRKHMEHSAATK